MRLNLKKQQGFTLIEVTIILLVLVILSTIMLPQLGNFNRLARFVKAREDVGAICATLKKMLDEVMLGAFYQNPPPNGTGSKPIGLLLGPGDTPLEGTEGDGDCNECPGDHDIQWQLAVGAVTTETETADDGTTDVEFLVDNLANHLQQNNPSNGMSSSEPYKNPLDNPERHLSGWAFGWRGPYLDELTTDPWGNRYAVNTFALYADPQKDASKGEGIFTSAVVCYSAGVDRGIDTIINQPANDADDDGFFGWQFGGDDIGAVLSAGGPF